MTNTAENAPLHRPSLVPASRGDHRGKLFCLECTMSVDDFTAYVDWPCRTARAAAEGRPVAASLRQFINPSYIHPDDMPMYGPRR